MRKTRVGTSVRRGLDNRAAAQAFKGVGQDPRVWCSYATICRHNEETGAKNFDDDSAIYIDASGMWVDVILEPDDVPMTCRYAGIKGGRGTTIYAPLYPGDLVVVSIPGGDGGAGTIQSVHNTAAHPMPLGDDGKPVFQNDKLLIVSDVPFEVRADQILLGGPASDLDFGVKGQTLQTFLESLVTWVSSHSHIVAGVQSGSSAASSTPPISPAPQVPDVKTTVVKVK